jgi:GTP cyclohydrolase I
MNMNAVEQGMKLAAGLDAQRKSNLPLIEDADGDFQRVHPRELINGLLQALDPAPAREGLHDTPARVVKAWEFWTRGYHQDPAEILKTFEDGAEGYDGMVLVKDIPLYSKCEHHLADIFGTACVAYIPNGRVVGLSKLSRVVDCFARRLQVQERLTTQIASALQEHLKPLGVGVIIRARHMCMESRGICQQGHHTVTTSLLGAMRDDHRTRAEFLQACQPDPR